MYLNNSLVDIGQKYGTDKVSHGFCHLYGEKFNQMKESVKNVLEIGVFFGASIQMWREYFPNATIHGFDTFEGLQGNGSRFGDADKFYKDWETLPHLGDRIQLYKHDQGKESDLITFVNEMKEKNIEFDLILDDGSHLMVDQQLTFKHLFEIVKNGGFYVIEDVHTSTDIGGYDVMNDTSNTTLTMIENYNKDKILKSIYTDMTETEKYVENIELYITSSFKSMTCLIKKKS